MDYIQCMQKAIAFMEDHILEPISYEDVARELYLSSYYFHRTFSMFTGMTVSEYLRNRRMSMAGQELVLSEHKIIDIALKYGYDSSGSFTKAFIRFHGVSPSSAKRSGIQLKSFNRLVIKVIVEGGTVLDYKIVKREPFTLIAKVKAFRNECISEEGNTDIPDFWKESQKMGVFEILKEHAVKQDAYGVCIPVSKESTHFHYGIGMEYDGSLVPDGYVLWEVKPVLWAVFKCIGTGAECITDTWNRVYKEFLPSSEYSMLDDCDFEFYPEKESTDCFCEIWIPVKKKSSC